MPRTTLRPGLPRAFEEPVDFPDIDGVRAVVAGLNRANALGHIGNAAAWRLEGLSDDDESETAVFLEPVQRQALIHAATADAAAFLRFFRLFAGRYHHAREEDVLFPALVATEVPGDKGPLKILLEAHQAMARVLDSMEAKAFQLTAVYGLP